MGYRSWGGNPLLSDEYYLDPSEIDGEDNYINIFFDTSLHIKSTFECIPTARPCCGLWASSYEQERKNYYIRMELEF